MRTRGPFVVRHGAIETSQIALQISRNLYQYFSADAEIVGACDLVGGEHSNVISIGVGRHLPLSFAGGWFPIQSSESRCISLLKPSGIHTEFEFQKGLGAIFLRPLPDERLELVVWGFDDDGLRYAARLVPMLAGVGQPDFIIFSKRCAWEGAGGVLAMGSFDCKWNISKASFIR